MEHKIQQDDDSGRFFVEVDGKEGYLRYSHRSTGTVDFQSTFVPPELRGEGIAAEIVEAALKWARSQGLKVVPSCSYVDHYLRKHPQFEDLRA